MPLDYVLGPPVVERNGGAIVRLADDARKCVVFLGVPGDSPKDFDIAGTGFFVSYGSPSRHYLVTAGHVAEELGRDPWGIRFNGFDGCAGVAHIDEAGWIFHPDYPAVDIAVLECDWPEDADGICFPQKAFASTFKMGTKDFGAGDLAYVSGLFRLLPGTARNQTFVHTGHIAVLPGDELIPVRDWRTQHKGEAIGVEGYVVEVTTLPGASGSPVFVRRSIATPMDVPVNWRSARLNTWVYGSVWLLGVWQGAWDGMPGEVYSTLVSKGTKVPVGLGVVSPASRLIEVLDMPALKDKRDQAGAQADLARAASPQSARASGADNPQHKEDFSRLLNAAASSGYSALNCLKV